MKQKKSYYLILILLVIALSQCQKDPYMPVKTDPYILNLPEGFAEPDIPEDNPLTVQGVKLGKKLFFDPVLSADSNQSCATCHQPAAAFTDPDHTFSPDAEGMPVRRQTPAIINVGYMDKLFWDGRAKELTDQANEALENEQHVDWADIIPRLNSHDEYPVLFAGAFGVQEITQEHVLKAIEQFELTLISGNSKYDRFLRGEVALTASESRGLNIFFTEKGDCFHCHGTNLLTDNLFHNNGLDSTFTSDKGLYETTGDSNDIGKFKAPTLRNIEFTAPYMHDGRFSTLEEVVNFYSTEVKFSPTIDPLMKKVDDGGVQLSPQERKDLVAFLKTLTDEEFLNNPEFEE